MRVIQADRGADGWWVLVESDEGRQHLLHVDGDRQTPKPTVGVLTQLVKAADASSDSHPAPDDLLAPGGLADLVGVIERATERLLMEGVDADDKARLDAVLDDLDAVQVA